LEKLSTEKSKECGLIKSIDSSLADCYRINCTNAKIVDTQKPVERRQHMEGSHEPNPFLSLKIPF
jgi:hypothetical protein